MKKSELFLILLMFVAVLVVKAVTVPVKWFSDLCFELAQEMQTDEL